MGCFLHCQEKCFAPIDMVIFDKDGTLAYSEPYLDQLGRSRTRFLDAKIPGVQEQLLTAFGFEEHGIQPQGPLAVGSRQENEIAAATYVAATGRDWVESHSIAKAAFQEADRSMPFKAATTSLIEGIEPLVRSLHHAQVRLGIISSDITKNVVEFAHQYDLAPYFDCLAGVDTVDKSDPEACMEFFQESGINPANIVVIGDSAADIRLAQSIGAESIGVTWGWDVTYSIHGAGAIAHHPSDITILTKAQ